MERKTDRLINRAVEKLAQTTGMKVVHQAEDPNSKNTLSPDGLVRIDFQNQHWVFAVQVQTRVSRATVVMEKAQPELMAQDCILITEYITPPMADLMKTRGLFYGYGGQCVYQ